MLGWSRARGLGASLALPLLVLGLAACREGDVSRQAPTPAATPHGSRLSQATISDPKTFNPVLVTDNASGEILRDVFESLVRLNPFTGEIEPLLAERWELDPDGRQCTLYLRRGVRWHDGRPFTAADVAFTLEAIYHPRVPNSGKYVLLIDGQPIRTEVVDDHIIRLLLPRPFAPLLFSLGFEIVPKHLLAAALAEDRFTQQWGINTPPEQIVGTGPYRIAQYVQGQFVRLRRNPEYWMQDGDGRRLPYIDERLVLIVPSQDTMYLKFRDGQTDLLWPRPEEVVELRKRPRTRVTEVGLDTGSLFVSFNRNERHYVRDGERAPQLDWFTDKSFLRAIAHAIDKRSLIQNTLYGFGRPAVAEISPENTVFHNPGLTDYEYDLGKSRGLLEEGGYVLRQGALFDRRGHRVEFALHTNAGNQIREKMCSIFKEDWEKLGIKVNYRPLDFTTLVEKLDTTYDWDAVLIGFTASLEPNNGANFLRSDGNLHIWNPRQEKPATEWEAEIDRLLDEGSRELDRQKRPLFYWRIQEILHYELPIVLTVYQARFLALRSEVEGFQATVWSPGVYRPELIRIAE
jgi:peptide/nickel transport system substrate-binding protein